MNTGLGILRSTIDLLRVASQPLMKSTMAESGAAMLVVENVITELQQVIDDNSKYAALYIENADEDSEYLIDPRKSPGLPTKGSLKRMSTSHSRSRPRMSNQMPLAALNRINNHNGSNHSNPPSRLTSEISSNSSKSNFSQTQNKGGNNDDGDIMMTSMNTNQKDDEKEEPSKHAPLLMSKEEQQISAREQAETYDLALKAQEAFMILDKDHSGFLDVSELREAFKSIPQPKLDEMIEEMISEIGHGQTVNVAEFVGLFTKQDNASFIDMRSAFTDITNDLIKEHNRRRMDMVKGTSKYLLDPRGFISVQWDLLIALLLITTVFTMPLSLAFEYFETTLFPLDVAADILFVLDVVKHFNCGYIDEFDYSIMDRTVVRKHYMSSWFVPDVMSSIPVEIINIVFTSGVPGVLKASRILKLLRLSRLTKVFRLMKITKLGKLIITAKEAFEDKFRVQIPEAFLILGRLWLSLLVLAHWVGCINFMVARLYDFPKQSWVVFAELEDASIGLQYSWCFFKALAQLIGVGFDIPPIVNTSCLNRTEWCTIEHWMTLTCLYIGSVYVALLISSISYVIVNMNKGSSNLSMQLWTLNEYLSNKKVPYDIRDRVRNFYRIRFAEGKMYDEEEVLRLLPPNLRDDILSFNQRLLFEQVPLLSLKKNNADQNMNALRSRLAPLLEKRVMFQHETIFDEGTIGSELYFIVSGIVEICSSFIPTKDDPPLFERAKPGMDRPGMEKPEEPKPKPGMVKAISDGCYFGDVAVLLSVRRTASTRARTNLVLSVISKKDFSDILLEFESVREYMLGVAKKRKDRLNTLDPDSTIGPLSDDQLKDEEDAQTKYFVKLTNVNEQDTLFQRASTLHRANSRRASQRNFPESALELELEGDDTDEDESQMNSKKTHLDLEDVIQLPDDMVNYESSIDCGEGMIDIMKRGSYIRPIEGRNNPVLDSIPSGQIGGDNSSFNNPLLNNQNQNQNQKPSNLKQRRSKNAPSSSTSPSRGLSPLGRPSKKGIQFRGNDSIVEDRSSSGGPSQVKTTTATTSPETNTLLSPLSSSSSYEQINQRDVDEKNLREDSRRYLYEDEDEVKCARADGLLR